TDLYHILFGNLLAVTHATFWSTVVVGLIVMILIITFYRPLMISTFDPIFSRMSGLNTRFLHYFVMLLLYRVTVSSIQSVGIILVVALLITPGSAAFLIAKIVHTMMIISSLISVISSFVGMYSSYIYNITSGATIVLCAFIIYIIT